MSRAPGRFRCSAPLSSFVGSIVRRPGIGRLSEVAVLSLLAHVVVVSGGCSQFRCPYHDELSAASPVQTPSVAGMRAVDGRRSTARREHAPIVMSTPCEELSVTHGPLIFEDPREFSSSNDERYVWRAEDYYAIFCSGGRFMLNLVALPVSEVVTHPWMLMESDGEPSKNWFGETHDAKRVCSANHEPDAVAEPTDSSGAGTH